jgi:phosphatidylinositol alpha-1,6-mannosyltransferase
VCHGAEITVPAVVPGLRQLLRRPLRRADVLFAVSTFTRRKVERLTGRSVELIGAGVDPSFRPGDAPAEPPVVVGCVSRFVPRKGQHRILRAVASLRSDGLDVAVRLVGRGRIERRLRRLATRLDVPTEFEVDLSFADLAAAYRRMHIFAMPCHSRWFGLEAEGFGVVFIEAAASGLPVVAGDSGGAPETVDPGRTGFVVDGTRSLRAALRTLVTDSQLRRSMGAAGAERAADLYTWSAVGARFRDGLERAVASHPG